MRRQKRPYFTFVVFITLLAFGLFLAWQSSVLSKQMDAYQALFEGRTLYLPYIGNMPCSQPPCQSTSPTTPAYPTRFESLPKIQDPASFSSWTSPSVSVSSLWAFPR